MKPRAFYNDSDPKACAWVRELMAAGLIMEGDVDERSIKEIQPEELAGYTRIHLFCGISGWDLALQLAGWPADRPVLTCSAPCQSFSCAGKGKGINDPRHLWPEAFRIIRALKPEFVIGEQVAAAIGHGWIDGVQADLARENYSCGYAVLGAHSVGAPHIRQRLYWCGLADTASPRRIGPIRESEIQTRDEARVLVSGKHGEDGGLADTNGGDSGAEREQRGGRFVQQPEDEATGGMGHADEPRSQGWIIGGHGSGERTAREAGLGFWDRYELIPCADGKQRRVEPGVAPLVASVPRGVVPGGDPGIEEVQNSGEARVMRLRGYGNSLCIPTAAQFIRAVMDL